jgi:hypothetical protein
MALLCLVALGLAGAICLLLYLAIKLVLAGLMSLILLLLAPAMLLAPAFGESGRATFVAWAKRLVGALAAKLIYALLLALVVVGATALASLEIGWFGTWLLQTAFWWGILIKRKELTGFLTVGHQDDRRGQSTLLRTYQTARLATATAAGAKAATLAAPSRARTRARETLMARSQASRRATQLAAEEELGRAAERARELELAGSRERVALRTTLDRERRALEHELAPYDRDTARARAVGQDPRPPTADEELWLDRRATLERALGSQPMRQAERTVAEAERSNAREGRVVTRADAAAWREQRRRDIDQGLPPEHERHLRAAGIDPRELRDVDRGRRAELVERSRTTIERHRALLAALPQDGAGQATPNELARADTLLGRDELRPRRREERARATHERHERQRRQGLYRR